MRSSPTLAVILVLATWVLGAGIASAQSQRPQQSSVYLPDPRDLLRAGHDGIDVNPALERRAGMVVALGASDAQGRIYSFRAVRLPAAPGYALNELRGWRLTVLAGERFSSVFEVESNTESEITVTGRDGPLNGLAVRDVFVLERIAVERPAAPVGTDVKPGT